MFLLYTIKGVYMQPFLFIYICPIYRAKKIIYVTRSIGCVVRASCHCAFSYCPILAGALAVRAPGYGLWCD